MNSVLTNGTGRRSNRMLAKDNRGQVAGKNRHGRNRRQGRATALLVCRFRPNG